MGTTADKLALLKANKQAIRDAITEKTGEDAGEVMSTYAEKIMNIQTGPEYWRTTILLDQTITDPATMITKVYDDGGIGLIRANSHRYVCKLVDGVMQAKQLQDGNGTLYLDGTTADLTGAEGDVMMKLPEFWYNAQEQETDKWLISFAYGAAPDSGYKHWDGKDFIGVYEAYVADSNVYSRSGVASTGAISQANFKTYARNRGDGYTLVKWKHHCIMAFLFYAEYLHTNSQAICGAGTDSADKIAGETDLLGMEDTVADVNGNTQSINYYGLENWWGNKEEAIDNVVVNPTSVDYSWQVTNNDDTVDTVESASLSGYIKKMTIGANLHLVPTNASASSTTSYCDTITQTSQYTGRCARRSGSYAGEDTGITFINSIRATTTADAYATSRLAYRGEYETFDGVFDAGYEALEYFESNGSQYFDTGFKPNNNTRVTAEVQVLPPISGNQVVFGVRTSAANKNFAIMVTAATFRSDFNNSYTQEWEVSTIKLQIDKDCNITTIYGVTKAYKEGTFQCDYPLYICALNEANVVRWPIIMDLYSCQIYDNGTLIRDYVPCVRKADGVSGLWDKVNKTFNTPITIA